MPTTVTPVRETVPAMTSMRAVGSLTDTAPTHTPARLDRRRIVTVTWLPLLRTYVAVPDGPT